MSEGKGILRRIGPGFMVASIVIGPGSIVVSSKAGAIAAYDLLWVILTAAILMAVYTAMGARLGCALDRLPFAYIAEHGGRVWAVLGGLSAFAVVSGFQFGNNLGLATAMQGLVGGPLWIWPVVFTIAAILFLFFAKRIYALLEKGMMILVAMMILCFVANLFFTGIDVGKAVGGLVPRLSPSRLTLVAAMLATNFSVIGAFFQAYLVRGKGWTAEDVGDAIRDTWAGIAAIACIIIVILIGSAETLYGTGAKLDTAGDLANQLNLLLGPAAKFVFCIGLGAAAFSSFIMNAMVGGAMLADGLGFDAGMQSKPTKILTTVALLLGSAVAIAVLQTSVSPTWSIIIAQASTLLAVPLAAVILIYLTSSKRVMGDLRNGPVTLILGIAGLVVVLLLIVNTTLGLYQKFAG
jgi:Mn2+/Fe2+ NRAMP family transporter